MFNIPNGVIFIWTGTNASIPAGWSRVTALDEKYPKGTANATNPNATGGNATHNHSSSAHTHATTAHTHSLSYGGSSGTDVDSGSGTGGARNGHGHSTQNSGAVSSDSIQNSTSTYSSISNNPPYYEVLFIKPQNGDVFGLPDGVVALTDSTTIPQGFTLADGNNSTTNLLGKYLKGASTGGNAGGTGGSTQNIHDLTHTHTTSHTHSSVTTDGANSQNSSTSGTDMASATHTHTVTVTAITPTTSDTPSLTTSETVEPAYTKLIPVQNKTGSETVGVGIIGLWLGLLSNIPRNWVLCDGTNGTVDMRGRHLKMIVSATSEVGNTGGSNTHTHSSQGHTHTLASHNHSASTSSFGSNTRHSGNGAGGVVNHTHSVTVSSVGHTLDSANTTADSSNNEPPYRTVAFIKLMYLTGGGAFLINLLK